MAAHLAAAASLVLCVGTLGLWVRSCWCFDYMCGAGGRIRLIVLSGAGEIQFCLMRYDREQLNTTFRRQVFYEDDLRTPGLRYSDYTLHHDGLSLPVGESSLLRPRLQVDSGTSRTYRDYWISLPYWMIAAVLSFIPAVYLCKNQRRTQNIATNRCGRCSYDLTGNTSGVCPECGTPASQEFHSASSEDMTKSLRSGATWPGGHG